MIEHLARQRGIADPRYDATMRAYERGLRRFVDYLSAHPGHGATEESIEAFLTEVREHRWVVPPSQHGLLRTVMNHLRAYLRAAPSGQADPGARLAR